MKIKLILFATIVVRGVIGMDAPLDPIVLRGKIEVIECEDDVAGYPSELLRTKVNNLYGANLIEEEDICVPVCISLQDPKKIKLGLKAIDNMPNGRVKVKFTKDLLELKELARTPQIIVLPAHKLQNKCDFTANKGIFSISYAFKQPYRTQKTIKALENKPVCFFAYQQEKQSDEFDHKVIRSFDLEKKKIVKPSEMFLDCLQSKASDVSNLLQLAERTTDKQQKEWIELVARDIHGQTIHQYFNFPEYEELFSTGEQEEDLIVLQSSCFSTNNIQENIRKRSLEIFSRNNPGNIFNAIQGKQVRK